MDENQVDKNSWNSKKCPNCCAWRVWGLVFFGTSLSFIYFVLPGYQSLQPILLNEKMFYYLCPQNHTNSSTPETFKQPQYYSPYGFTTPKMNVSTCPAQIFRVEGIMTVAVSVVNFGMVIFGLFIDYLFGPKITGIISGAIYLCGCIIFSFSNVFNWLSYPGFILIAFASNMGEFFFLLPLSKILKGINNFLHVPNAVPKFWQSVYSVYCMAANNSGAVVFLVYYYLYFYANVSFRALFLILGIIPVSYGVMSVILQPWRTFKPKKKEEEKEDFTPATTAEGINNSDDVEEEEGSGEDRKSGGEEQDKDAIVDGKNDGGEEEEEGEHVEKEQVNINQKMKNFKQVLWGKVKILGGYILTLEYLFLSLILMLGISSSYFYMTTLKYQFLWLTSGQQEAKIEKYCQIFGYFLLTISLFSSVFSGFLMTPKLGGVTTGWIFLAVLSIIQTTCSVIPNLDLQIFTMVVYCLQRGCFYGVFVYCAVLYFPELIMTCLGIMCILAASFNFLNYVFIPLSHDNFFWWNIGFGTIYVALLVLMIAFEIIKTVRKRLLLRGQITNENKFHRMDKD